jgi:Protein of unknown function (DUF2793)/Concanavalin A-like lectin/glucanases superfamily
MTFPRTEQPEYTPEQASPWIVLNQSGRIFDAFCFYTAIADRNLTEPPIICDDGARYLVAASPTGDWTGQAGNVAVAVGTDAANGWLFIPSEEGQRLWVADEDLMIQFDGSNWVLAETGGGGGGGVSETITESGTSANLLNANAGKYQRWTNAGAKTLTVRPDGVETITQDSEFHLRNVGAGDLTISAGSGVVINPPAGGGLVLETDMNATLKRVAINEFDLFGQTVSGPPAIPFSQVVLLMGFEGTLPTDESSYAHTVTVYGASTENTATQFKYGSKSLSIPNTSDRGLGVPDNSVFTVGTQPFTHECFVRFTDRLGSSELWVLLSQGGTSSTQFAWEFAVDYVSATQLVLYYYQEQADFDGTYLQTSNFTYDLDTWYHMAVDFDGTTYRLYIDGVPLGSETYVTVPRDSNGDVGIGCRFSSSMPVTFQELRDAFLDEVRMTIGTARYATAVGFTPPTEAFPRA